MEILEEEKRADIYSPQLSYQFDSEKLHLDNGDESSGENIKGSRCGGCEHLYSQENCPGKSMKRNIFVDDKSCSLCKEMLYQPAVLNHGHEEEFPRVCSEKRTSKAQCQPANPSTSTLQPKKLKAKVPCEAMGLLWLNEDMSAFIVGVVCDSCEIYLIIGKRYKCKDWKEAVGFDLCEACYNTKSKLPGRFNQQHTPDHKFELDEPPHMLRNILLQRASMFNIAQQRPEVVCPYG